MLSLHNSLSEAVTFSFTNLFFPPSRFSLFSSGRSLCCLPHFAPTASRKKRAEKHSLRFEPDANTRGLKIASVNFTRRRTEVIFPVDCVCGWSLFAKQAIFFIAIFLTRRRHFSYKSKGICSIALKFGKW